MVRLCEESHVNHTQMHNNCCRRYTYSELRGQVKTGAGPGLPQLLLHLLSSVLGHTVRREKRDMSSRLTMELKII